MPIDTEPGASALQPWRKPINYKSYKSPHGPQYVHRVDFYAIMMLTTAQVQGAVQCIRHRRQDSDRLVSQSLVGDDGTSEEVDDVA